MPELPDLLYIQKHLQNEIIGRTVLGVTVRQPVVLRNTLDRPPGEALAGKRLTVVDVRGPFLRFDFTGSVDVVLNLMLAGKLQHQRPAEKPLGHLCLSLHFDDGSLLNLCDDQKMAKAYLVNHGDYRLIPRYDTQGTSIFSSSFTRDSFRALAARHTRKQVRVFINDQTILSAIGNAYADEILFDAGIHPKTFVAKLSPQEIERLYNSICSVLQWGVRCVEEARRPIHDKVRDHMKIRNRKGEPCPRCGTKIRRAGVRGYDTFFCPRCQPASRKLFLDWREPAMNRDSNETTTDS